MITGVSSIRDERIQHGEDRYLISASTLHRDDGDAYYVTVLKNSYIKVEAHECADFDKMLELYNQTVEKYRAIAET